MTTKLRPMKAEEFSEDKARFPGWGSPKFDGLRCWGKDSGAYSNTLKLLPNSYLQEQFHKYGYFVHGLDGEVVVGEPNHPNVMQATSSGIMSQEGEPNFTYLVFDTWTLPELPFDDRKRALEEFACELPPFCKLVEHKWITSQAELDAYEAEQLALGYEGIMYRAADAFVGRRAKSTGPADGAAFYKYGRSTHNEGLLLKVKRFRDDEATIVGYEELMHNGNEAQINELGLTERSSHQENLVPSGMMGSYWVQDLAKWPQPFKISCGSMDHDARRAAWLRRDDDIGRQVTFKHFPHGMKEVPRHGIFRFYRDPMDITNY